MYMWIYYIVYFISGSFQLAGQTLAEVDSNPFYSSRNVLGRRTCWLVQSFAPISFLLISVALFILVTGPLLCPWESNPQCSCLCKGLAQTRMAQTRMPRGEIGTVLEMLQIHNMKKSVHGLIWRYRIPHTLTKL